jgi:diaminopimelate decarboxylase
MDCSVQDVELPRPVPGDIIGFFNAGAYGYTMSLLDFMSLERPTELLADRGSVRQIR